MAVANAGHRHLPVVGENNLSYRNRRRLDERLVAQRAVHEGYQHCMGDVVVFLNHHMPPVSFQATEFQRRMVEHLK